MWQHRNIGAGARPASASTANVLCSTALAQILRNVRHTLTCCRYLYRCTFTEIYVPMAGCTCNDQISSFVFVVLMGSSTHVEITDIDASYRIFTGFVHTFQIITPLSRCIQNLKHTSSRAGESKNSNLPYRNIQYIHL